MTEKTKKFLMLHVNEKDSRSVLTDAYDEGIQRGLVIESNIGKDIKDKFSELKGKGYFPVGIIIGDNEKIEFVFKRHPKQTKDMRLKEISTDNPLEL